MGFHKPLTRPAISGGWGGVVRLGLGPGWLAIKVPKMEGFLNLIAGCFGDGDSLT